MVPLQCIYISLIRKKSDATKKVPFFRRSNWIIFLILVFKIEESETADTYVGKKGILYT
jgi:hypothetical protein